MDEITNKKIVIVGFMGSGKTYWGKIWSNQLSIQHVDLDEKISKEERLSISEIFKLKGEEYFRKKEAEFLNTLLDEPSIILSTGGGTPCFNNNIKVILQKSISFYLKCNPETLFTRLKSERSSRPLISSLSDKDLGIYIEQKIAEREVFYNQANYILEEEKINLKLIKDLIIA
ncbi:MAG: shikimate kinase [Ginsengibacter sp.]